MTHIRCLIFFFNILFILIFFYHVTPLTANKPQTYHTLKLPSFYERALFIDKSGKPYVLSRKRSKGLESSAKIIFHTSIFKLGRSKNVIPPNGKVTFFSLDMEY